MGGNSWFPIARGLLENEGFRTLTATEKLYLWQIMSEFNLNDGEFYRADIWFAATLKLSVEKIHKARRKLANLGFIQMIPGKQDIGRGKNIATTYKSVKWLNMPEGEQFSQIDRPTFERLIDYLRRDTFTHEDVVCWVYIFHLCWCSGGRYAVMAKSSLFHVTNIPRAVKCIRNLLSKFKFTTEEGLFHFSDGHHSVKFENIRTAAFSQEHLNERYKNIEDRIQAIRDKEKKKEKEKLKKAGGIFAEDLIPLFVQLYEKEYGKKPVIGRNRYDEKLRVLGEPRDVARALELFFSLDLPDGLANRTIYNFTEHAEKYMNR
jgi:hypothetical protein